MTSTLQALSLVEKVEPVQVRFTLHLRDQWSMWMQDGCIVYMGFFLHGIKWIMFHPHLTIFNDHLLEIGLTLNMRPCHSTHSQLLLCYIFIMCEDSGWIEMHWNSIWLRAQSHRTAHYTWGSVTTLHDFGMAFGHFFWALTISWSRLGSCVKWPLAMLRECN